MERENYLEDLQKKTPKTWVVTSLKWVRSLCLGCRTTLRWLSRNAGWKMATFLTWKSLIIPSNIFLLSHSEDLSCIQSGNRRREQNVPYDKPRYLHTSREFFTRHAASDQERMNWRPAQYNRHLNEYHDLKPRCRSEDRYLPVDNHTQLRSYTSRRFPNREQRDHSNYRNSAGNYHHPGNNYYNYDNYRHYDDLNHSRNDYRNHENSYHNYNNYASYDFDDFQPGRSREESYRRDHVMRSKPPSTSNRPKPYSYQRGRR